MQFLSSFVALLVSFRLLTRVFFRDQIVNYVFAAFQISLLLYAFTKLRNCTILKSADENYPGSLLSIRVQCRDYRKHYSLENLTIEFDLFIKSKLHCHLKNTANLEMHYSCCVKTLLAMCRLPAPYIGEF